MEVALSSLKDRGVDPLRLPVARSLRDPLPRRLSASASPWIPESVGPDRPGA